MNNMLNDKKYISLVATLLLMIVLAINTFFMVVNMISNLNGRKGYSKEDIERYIEDKDYPMVTDMVYENEVRGKNEGTSDYIKDAIEYEESMLK